MKWCVEAPEIREAVYPPIEVLLANPGMPCKVTSDFGK